LTIHGCGGEADDIAEVFGNYAAANDIIMVFPQASGCYMGDAYGDEEMEWNQVARDGSMMTFMKGIFDRVTDTDTSSLFDDLATGTYAINNGECSDDLSTSDAEGDDCSEYEDDTFCGEYDDYEFSSY